MSKVLALCLLCLLPALAHAQPSNMQLVEAQGKLIEQLSRLTFVKTVVAREAGEDGRTVGTPRAFVYRPVQLDNRGLYAKGAKAEARLTSVTLTRMDRAATFQPAFITGSCTIYEEGKEGELFRFRIVRRKGSPGFEGHVWADSEGRVLRAVGVHVYSDRKPHETPLRLTYEADRETGLPASVTEEGVLPLKNKNGGFAGHVRVEVLSTFFDWREFKSEEPKEIEMGDEP